MKIILEVRTIKYAGLIKNDIAAAPGVCVSFFTQGCPFRCEGCHNPDTWDYDGGREFTEDTMEELLEALTANKVHRDLCIMGGEPLSPKNLELVASIIERVKEQLPELKIYIWTGYVLEDLVQVKDNNLYYILNNINYIIDGQYEYENRDITLHMRGSRNQRIWQKGETKWKQIA